MTDLLQPLLIRASAGTGKTFRLSNRFLTLLLAGESPDKILATTFTRKAAGEIQERVFQRLAQAASSSKAASALGEFVGHPSLSSSHALSTLAELVAQQHRLQICTLDSFCIRVAKCFSFEMGLLPGWTMLDGARGVQLRQYAIAESCRMPDSEEFVELLRHMNRGDANRSVQNRLDSMVGSMYQLFLDSDQSAWEWLSPPEPLSTDELADACKTLEGVELPRTQKGAVKKRWESARTDLLQHVERGHWDQLLANGLIKKVLEGGDPPMYDRSEIEPPLLGVLRVLTAHAASDLLTELSRQTKATYRLMEMFHREFLNLKFSEGVLEFTDVKRLLAQASFLSQLDDVYYRLDGAIRHVLLDEFQDTSMYEWNVVLPVIDEVLAHADGEHTFFCVGDVKQAIYGWRGGVAAIFDSLQERFGQIKRESMEKSYRSSPIIMDLVNLIFGSLASNPALVDHPETVSQWVSGFKEHESGVVLEGGGSFPGYGCVRYYQRVDDESPGPTKMQQLALDVQELLATGKQMQIGILVRANKGIAEILYELSRMGIEASGEGGSSLLDSAAVTPILALLRMVDHPGDTISCFHVAHSPLTDLLGQFQWDSRREVDAVVARVQSWLFNRGLPYLVDTLCEPLRKYCCARDLKRLDQLAEIAHEFTGGSSLRLQEFIDFVKFYRVQDNAPAQVRVMTIHQSKGLEFDAVFLPELDKRLLGSRPPATLLYRESPLEWPSKVSIYPTAEIRALSPDLEEMHQQMSSEKLQEELCVLYVALTRAKQALYLYAEEPRRPDVFPPTAAGLIRGALEEQFVTPDESGIVFEIGDTEWFAGCDSIEEFFATQEKKIPAPVFREGAQRKRGLPRKAPSGLEGGEVFSLDVLFGGTVGGAAKAANRGTILHLLFEQIEWIEEFQKENTELLQVLLHHGVRGEEATLLVEEFRELLEQQEIQQMLSRGYYQPSEEQMLRVERELPFAVRDGESLLTGIIDRVVLHLADNRIQSAHIIDYKSDRNTGDLGEQEWLDQKREFYAPQLQAYSFALQSLYGVPASNISASLLFVSTGISAGVNLK